MSIVAASMGGQPAAEAVTSIVSHAATNEARLLFKLGLIDEDELPDDLAEDLGVSESLSWEDFQREVLEKANAGEAPA